VQSGTRQKMRIAESGLRKADCGMGAVAMRRDFAFRSNATRSGVSRSRLSAVTLIEDLEILGGIYNNAICICYFSLRTAQITTSIQSTNSEKIVEMLWVYKNH
jgi:hypothetical protein